MTAMTTPNIAPLIIDVAYDVICPWCWIGKRHLDAALAELRVQRPNAAVQIRWQPVQLLPQMPIEGIPFLAFYIPRLGSFEAVHSRQAQVRSAAEPAGLASVVSAAMERGRGQAGLRPYGRPLDPSTPSSVSPISGSSSMSRRITGTTGRP